MKHLLLVALLGLSLFSCKKDKDGPASSSGANDFVVQTAEGSWWVYDWYTIDTNGTASPTSMRDSVYVSKDTTVRGHRYAMIEGTFLGQPGFTRTERDSNGFIVSAEGNIHYTYTRFGSVYAEGDFFGFIRWRDRMHDGVDVQVSAGSFGTVESRRTHYHASGFPINNCGDSTFVFSTWYATGIGQVKQTTGYYTSIQNCGSTLEARLTNYFIAPE